MKEKGRCEYVRLFRSLGKVNRRWRCPYRSSCAASGGSRDAGRLEVDQVERRRSVGIGLLLRDAARLGPAPPPKEEV